MRYHMELSTLVLQRVLASFRSVPHVLLNGGASGDPIATNLPRSEPTLSGEQVQMLVGKSTNHRRLGD